MSVAPIVPDPANPHADFLAAVAAVAYDVVPVANSVIDPTPEPLPQIRADTDPGRRARLLAKAMRRAARRRRRRAAHPERFRIEFRDWVAIPWRDRPIEARLGDWSQANARAIAASPAWGAELLAEHRLRLDPFAEAAGIALGAYRVYQVRRELGPAPVPGGPLAAVVTAYREKATAVELSWQAVVDRAVAFDSYRRHVAALTPLIEATRQLARIDGERFGRNLAELLTLAAGTELAADETWGLDAETAALVSTARSALDAMQQDLQQLGA